MSAETDHREMSRAAKREFFSDFLWFLVDFIGFVIEHDVLCRKKIWEIGFNFYATNDDMMVTDNFHVSERVNISHISLIDR